MKNLIRISVIGVVVLQQVYRNRHDIFSLQQTAERRNPLEFSALNMTGSNVSSLFDQLPALAKEKLLKEAENRLRGSLSNDADIVGNNEANVGSRQTEEIVYDAPDANDNAVGQAETEEVTGEDLVEKENDGAAEPKQGDTSESSMKESTNDQYMQQQEQRSKQTEVSEKPDHNTDEQMQHVSRPVPTGPEMSWDWFWASLTQEQQNTHSSLSESQQHDLWEQKRIQFLYSTKRIPDIQNITPPDEIPRLIHFIYISPGLPLEQPNIPEDVIVVLDKWQKLHPEYLVVLWRNVDIIEHFPHTLRTLRSVPVTAWVADVLRYYIMEKVGGVYFDTDMNPIHSIEPIRKDYGPFFSGCEWAGRHPKEFVRHKSEYVKQKCALNNNVIGVIPHHAALKEASESAMWNTQEKMATWEEGKSKFSMKTAGPNFWRSVATKYEVNKMSHTLFQPCGWGKHSKPGKCKREWFLEQEPAVIPHVYTIHEFQQTWLKKDKDEDAKSHLIAYDPNVAQHSS